MKKLLPLLAVLLFTACQKQISDEKMQKAPEQTSGVAEKGGANRIDVCHNGHTISISYAAWPAHQAHGDVLGTCPGYVSICGINWMIKNLDVITYRDGTPIPQVQDPGEWANLTTGAWCYYNNDLANGPVYGKLYNWYAVTDPRGLAPTGWHVPSDDEWTNLITCLGGDEIAGSAMKETGTTHWLSPNSDATNSSGFTGLAGGGRGYNGGFFNLGVYGSWWSVTAYDDPDRPGFALSRSPYYGNGSVRRDADYIGDALSVRCVRD